MYPYEWLRPAWERLWSAVHALAPWTPAALQWEGDVHDHWADHDCQVAQACGWPVVTALRDRVCVVGAFALALGDADGHRYRSVVLANRATALADVVPGETTAAVNAPDSLSGWVSLLAATVGPGATWTGPVCWTGGHEASLRALQDGRADIASVDALSLAYLGQHDPAVIAGLHEIGRGPWVPSLPVVVPTGTPPVRIDELRHAIAAALSDPALAEACGKLLLDGFVALDESAFSPLLALAPAR